MSDWKVYLGVPAAMLATVSLWGAMGFPRPATSADVEKLDREQSRLASEVYAAKVRSLLTVPPPENPTAKQIWQEEINRARDQERRAVDRLIELGK